MNIQTEKAYVGYYATRDDYDGAPDAGFNCIGWGETPEEAEADLREQLHTEGTEQTDEKGRPMTYWGGMEKGGLHPDCRGPWDRGETNYSKEEHIRDCLKCQNMTEKDND